MHKATMIPKIKAYIKCSAAWHDLGEPAPIEDGPGLKMIELEDDILIKFGLPAGALCYSNILQQAAFTIDEIEENAEYVYHRLLKEAEKFLLSPAQTGVEILRTAKDEWTLAQDALSFMGFDTTTYTGFLYHDIYLSGACTEEELLQYLKFGEAYVLKGARVIPFQYPDLMNSYEELEQDGLPRLEEYATYLKYIFDKHEWDLDVANLPDYKMDIDEHFLCIDLFYLGHFEIIDAEYVYALILVYEDGIFYRLPIYCFLNTFNDILRYARYTSRVMHLRMSEQDLDFVSDPYVYHVYRTEGCNHEICGCLLTLELFHSDENVQRSVDSFRVVSIVAMDEIVYEDIDDWDDLPF
ncbi:MAG: hypothetical protein JNJ58_00770 [Chitinophagaceae bacterium]|nr:hypothetical protein [Chitinophagaceae bacterium]